MLLNVLKSNLRIAGGFLQQNSPTILTGLAVGGFFSTIFLAVEATPKALDIIHTLELDHTIVTEDYDYKLPFKEKVLWTWKCYTPAIVMGTLTVCFIVGANTINLRRNAAIVSLYSITEATLKEYQSKVVETIGEKKEKAIRDKVSQERLNKNPLRGNTLIITGKGDTLFYDTYSGRYFKSDIEKVRKIENQFNKEIINGYWADLNTFYHMLGMPTITGGEEVGWNTDKLMELEFDAMLAENDQPCIVMNYISGPKATFR